MKEARCPNCNASLSDNVNYCLNCGVPLSIPDSDFTTVAMVEDAETLDLNAPTERLPHDKIQERMARRKRVLALQLANFPTPGDLTGGWFAGRHGTRRPATVNAKHHSRSGRLTSPSPPSSIPMKLPDADLDEEPDDDEQHTPTGDLFSQRRQVTWHKEVESHHTPVAVPTLPPRPVTSPPSPIPVLPLPTPSRHERHVPPGTFFWASLLILIMLVLGGVFGIIVTFGRGLTNNQVNNHQMSLQVSPSNLPIGATMTLRGSNFTPHGKVGLARDGSIPLLDTGGVSIITADAHGNFTDTVLVDTSWEAGEHLISAEDATLHKVAQFPIFVIGNVQSLRPAHLSIMPSTLNMGAADIATSSIQTLTLSNLGGGQISWQGHTNKTWVQISPSQGTFASSQHVQITVAVNRSGMNTGNHSADISITSNAGDSTIPVQMQVTPLRPEHEAVLQISQAVLTFSAIDGGQSPAAQQVTISNPGILPLNWQATTSTSWLSFSPQSGSLENGTRQMLSVNVNTSTLLPGTYSGVITVAGQGSNPVQDSPQNIYVNVTILPQCSLQVSPGNLTFAGIYQQPAPAAQTVTLSPSQSCTSALQWTASTSAGWLTVSATSGSTPASPSIGININNLQPGIYNGSVYFSTSAGTQTVPVTFTMGQPTAPLLAAAPTALNFSGILGQPNPAAKTFTITNTGGGTLNWQTTVTTAVGGNWLTLTPASGSLGLGQSATVSVNVATLNTLVAGTYKGTITVTGTDGTGKQVGGSPQTIAVTFVVQSPCAITVTPTPLTFTSIAGQATPLAAQALSVAAGGACANTLNWTATATTAAGGNWLTVTPASGTATLNTAGTSSISVTTTGLAAGTYNGTVTITATDSVTNAPVGTPQQIPVTLTVQPPCSLQAPSPTQLTFTTGQGTNPATQTFTLGATGACADALTVTPTVTTQSGTGWLAVTPGGATLTSGGNATFTVTVTSASLTPGTYNGTVTIAATDSVTNAPVGTPQQIPVTLTVQPPCSLQAPSATQLTFTAESGTNPATQTFTLSATGACAGAIAVTPTVTTQSGTGWLAVTPTGATLTSGGNATFTVTVTSASLTPGTYQGSIALAATNGGAAIVGSPQTVSVTLTVVAPPALAVAPTSATVNVTTGITSTPLTLTNKGGSNMNWKAALPASAPAFVTLSVTAGNNVSGGSNQQLDINVNATGLAGGSNYTTSVTITATDPATGNPAANSPLTIPIIINVAAPAMQLSTTTLSFSAMAGGSNPASQTVGITNTGGDGLQWTVDTPSATWLTVTPTSGSDTSGTTSNLTFSVDITGIATGQYSSTVVITPTPGSATTITVNLTVS
jgi:hypothetical protein